MLQISELARINLIVRIGHLALYAGKGGRDQFTEFPLSPNMSRVYELLSKVSAKCNLSKERRRYEEPRYTSYM